MNAVLGIVSLGLFGYSQYQYFLGHSPIAGGVLAAIALGLAGLWYTRWSQAKAGSDAVVAESMETFHLRVSPWVLGVVVGGALLLGQIFILFLKKPLWGGVASGAGILAGVALLGLGLLKFLPKVCGWAALLLAVLAQVVIKQNPSLGLWLFFGAGLLLFLARPLGEKNQELSGIPQRTAAYEKWELFFFIALLAFAVFTRFVHLNHFPYSAIREEGEQLPVIIDAVANHIYMPHFLNGNMGIPSLIGYIGYYWGKWFGFTIDNLRVGVEFFSVAGILAFYFVTRRLTSPGTAAVTSVLFASSTILLILARRYYPYAIHQFTPLAAIGLLLMAFNRQRVLTFLLAGLALGFSLHGHEPGRGAFLIILFWQGWMWVFHRPSLPAARYLAWFWAGFLIVASPIIYHAFAHWDNYWNYVNHHVNPNYGRSTWTYVQFVWSKIPTYAAMFHIKGEWYPVVHFANEEALDPVIGLLFGLGFFCCTAMFWRPLPSLLLMYFFAGMLPAFLAGGYAEPTTRRMCMAFPAVFLIGALGLERLRLSLATPGMPWLKQVVIGLVGLGALWAAYHCVHYYFYDWADYPGSRHEYCYRAYLKCEAEKAYPQASIRQQESMSFPQEMVLYPGGEQRPKASFRTNEEFLIMNPQQDYLLLLEGYMEPMLPFFQRNFPHAEIKVSREPKISDEFCSRWEFLKNSTDSHNPAVYLIQIYIPREDVKAFHSLLDAGSQAGSLRLAAFAPDFAEKQRGRGLKLKGALLTKDGGDFLFGLEWKGWSLKIDGKPRAWGQVNQLNGSIHYFEISGQVPAGARGALPLSIRQNQTDCLAAGQVVALAPDMGLTDYYMPGDNNWDAAPVYSRQELFPIKRFYDVTDLPIPFSTRWVGSLQVPRSGVYHFTTKPYAGYRILLNGKEVFNNFSNLGATQGEPVELQANQPVKFEAFFRVGGEIFNRTFMLFYTGPGQSIPTWVPLEWLSLSNAQAQEQLSNRK